VKTIINLRVPSNAGSFLGSSARITKDGWLLIVRKSHTLHYPDIGVDGLNKTMQSLRISNTLQDA
jgi:hypothetical protein